MKKKKSELSNNVVKVSETIRGLQQLAGLCVNELGLLSEGAVSLEARVESVTADNQWVKEQFLAFADHKDSCDIRESANEGRIVEGIECTCGFAQLRLQFESELRR